MVPDMTLWFTQHSIDDTQDTRDEQFAHMTFGERISAQNNAINNGNNNSTHDNNDLEEID